MTQKRCLRKHCTLPAQIILIRQAPSCRGRNPNKSSCFHLCPLFFDRITAEEGGERRGRGEDEGRSARPPTPERMTTSLSPPGTLQKEFAAFPWAEIILVVALSWVKKKKSFRAKKCCCHRVWREWQSGARRNTVPPPSEKQQVFVEGASTGRICYSHGRVQALARVDKWSVPVWQLLFSCENTDFMVQDQFCQIKSKCNNHWAIAIWYLNTPTSLILLLILKQTPQRRKIFFFPGRGIKILWSDKN